MSYLSVSQTAEKWGISTRRIQILCGEGRITGRNADRCILGHSGGCYKTNRREDQERQVCKENHRKEK